MGLHPANPNTARTYNPSFLSPSPFPPIDLLFSVSGVRPVSATSGPVVRVWSGSSLLTVVRSLPSRGFKGGARALASPARVIVRLVHLPLPHCTHHPNSHSARIRVPLDAWYWARRRFGISSL
eukprot:scaffold122216_cov35-Tisochrysis_lutea.AAC.2